MSHFELILSTKVSDVIPVKKYVSEKTGLTVIIGDVEGPLVNGFFCLATEAHDDDGLPHTLEHLIFLGSERYPYKGVLDLLANRCMAQGTNAWTDVDHTCYTIQTAGDAGMLTLLPIYLDHILRPTLSEHGFITEVHHIDGDGKDAGVVYCEMQGRENTPDSRCELHLIRAMYPGSGYSSETGGIMKNLRTSTDNNKVRNFHKKFYRSENLTIILTGQINAEDVFAALSVVEDDIIAKRESDPQEEWVKPWQTVPAMPRYGEYEEYWPSDTEDCGQVAVGWRGPVLREAGALRELAACALLLRYLCESAAAPLRRRLVQRDDARAGDVTFSIAESMASLLKIQIENVPLKKLEIAKKEAIECITSIRKNVEPIDLERMRRLVRKQLRECLAGLESDPHQAIAFRCIGDALYSQDKHHFISRMNPQIDLYDLLEEPKEYWLNVMQKYFTEDFIAILGSPRIDLLKSMAEEEKKRTEEQKTLLGESGLAEKANLLARAVEFNERPPPDGTLASVPVPSCEGLKCHSIATWSSEGARCPHLDLAKLPLYTRVHSLKTNFVYINLVFDTSRLEASRRAWLPLWVDALAQCAVRRGEREHEHVAPHEHVVADTERLTVLLAGRVGLGSTGNFSVGNFGNYVHVETRCEPQDYEEVVNHLYEVLYASEITKERLLVFVQRLLNDVAQVRRNVSKLVYAIARDVLYTEQHNVHWCSVLRQHRFLRALLERLAAGGDCAHAALREAQDVFSQITEKPWLHIATDFDRYKLNTGPWKKFSRENEITPQLPKILHDADHMCGNSEGCVVGVGGIESVYVAQYCPGPRGYTLSMAPLLVVLNYFTQLEGPMWRLIRGCGLAYSYAVTVDRNEGRLIFSLYRATNAVAAYTKAREILEEYLKDQNFDEDLFASAKSTTIFDIVQQEKCPADVISNSLHNYLQQVPETFNSELVCAVAGVSVAAARAAAARWLPAMLDAEQSSIAVVCHPAEVKHLCPAFEKIGVNLKPYNSIEESHLNK